MSHVPSQRSRGVARELEYRDASLVSEDRTIRIRRGPGPALRPAFHNIFRHLPYYTAQVGGPCGVARGKLDTGEP